MRPAILKMHSIKHSKLSNKPLKMFINNLKKDPEKHPDTYIHMCLKVFKMTKVDQSITEMLSKYRKMSPKMLKVKVSKSRSA